MRARRHYGCDVGVWCCGRPKFTMAVGDAGVATGYGLDGLRRWWWSVWWDGLSKNGLKGCLRGSLADRGCRISGVGRVGRGLGRSGIRRGCEDGDGWDATSISDAGAGMSRRGRDMTPAHTGTGWPASDSIAASACEVAQIEGSADASVLEDARANYCCAYQTAAAQSGLDRSCFLTLDNQCRRNNAMLLCDDGAIVWSHHCRF